MNGSARISLLIVGFIVFLGGQSLSSENSTIEADFLRYVESPRGAQLQTAITSFENDSGKRVDLIGAVHIADKAYYQDLNARFRTYDGVLYELVGGAFKPGQNHRPSGDHSKMQWVGVLQESMKNALQLSGQIEGIDYGAPNMIHADMGMGEFFGTLETKGESFLGLWVKAWRAQMKVAEKEGTHEQPGLARILEILCRKDSASELKRIVAKEFDQVERLMEGIEVDGGTVVIGERNRVALQVLERELQGGKKKVGIFYGAAHMPDMSLKLKGRGFRVVGTEWITAWDLPAPEKNSP